MQLSLSVRIAESLEDKRHLALPFEEIVRLGAATGYEALCLRASVVSVASSPERVAEVRQRVHDAGLAVSMVTGDIALAANDDHATDALHNITPYLDLAQAFDCRRVRVMMQTEGDIALAQRASDEARERDLLLCHQTHARTLCETVDECLEVVRRVGRPNFGLTYEPTQLMLCGDDYGPEQIERLAPHLFNVYLQNAGLRPDGSTAFQTNHRTVRGDVLALGDPRGVSLDRVFQGLHRVGYDGWVTVHATTVPELPVAESIARYHTLLSDYLAQPI